MSANDADDDRTRLQPPVPPDDDRTVIVPGAAAGTGPAPVPAPPAAADDDGGNALPVGTRLGEFELTRVLGEGGFGIVYLAQDHSLHRRVAVKEYMPSALAARRGANTVSVKSERHRETFEAGLKSFVNEARLLAQFDHPSLVKVYRFWEANGTAYMVMPFYEGITLKDKLRELGSPPDEAWLMALLAPLTEALAVIHAEHCYHRDIAPDNVILLAGSGKPLLLDFGAARRVIGDMTQALTVILKPGYAPLEQYAEVPSLKQGPWTDVYALAAVVYFAIQGRTPPVSVGRIMGDSYVPLADAAQGRYTPTFLAAVDRALKVRPEDRTPSIDAFRADLGLAAGTAPTVQTVLHGDGAARGTSPAPAPRTAGTARVAPEAAAPAPKRGAGLWLGLGGGALLLGGIGAFYALTPSAPPPPPPPAPTAAAEAPAPAPAAAPAPSPAATPSPAPAPAPAALAPAPFSVAGEFDKLVQAQTSGFSVNVIPQRAQLRIGRDRLVLDVTSTRDGYAYLFVLGPDGSLVLLHPSDASRANRVRAGQVLRLPPAPVDWQTYEPAGVERLLLMVSARPRDFAATGARKKDGLLEFPTGGRAAALAAQHAGPGSVFGGSVRDCPAGAADCADYGASTFSVEIVR